MAALLQVRDDGGRVVARIEWARSRGQRRDTNRQEELAGLAGGGLNRTAGTGVAFSSLPISSCNR